MTEQSPEALPPEIEVTDLDDGVRYRLPQRIHGPLRWIGLLPLGVGLIFLTAPGTVLVFGVVALAAGNFDPGWVIGLLGLLFLVPFMLVGAAACWFGLNLLAGDVEMEVRAGQLRSVSRAAKVRWGGSRRLDNLGRLVLVGVYKRADGTTEPPQQWATLRVDCIRGGPMNLATGYPLTLLTPLANDLARRCRAAGTEFLPVVTEIRQRRPGSDPDIVLGYVSVGAPEEAGQAPVESWPTVERTDQPKASQIVVEQDGASVTLTIPPGGLRGSHLVQLVVGLVMSLGLATVTVLVILYGMNQLDWGGLICGFPISLLFEALGLFLAVTAIDGSRRRAIVAVAGGRLMILTQGPFGTRRREWTAAALADVRPGPSGTRINDVPVLELQVLPRDGEKFGLLAARDVDELEWIATLLRRSLGLPPVTPGPNPLPAPVRSGEGLDPG